ncbi:hypothetical protein [Bdellovibrio sp. HCB337]|uniref:hypothetical protein n=1 Tax=Bdellovibrio sp. HCB337 TaxID=3394358 RepID=UPI0039A43E62
MTWQILGNFGVGIPVMNSTVDQQSFSNHDGFGVPMHLAFAGFHPNETSGQLHWGYSMDAMLFSKTYWSYLGSDSAEIGQVLLGGSVLYYLNDRRTMFLRSSLGFSGITYEHETNFYGDRRIENRSEYSNGYGFLVEIGDSFKTELFAEMLTYSLTLAGASAFSKSGVNADLGYISANIGILW